MTASGYIGRFAPSPTGPLHAGSLVAALAGWLDARAHGGAWLVRIEDVDGPRGVPGADRLILRQLAAVGLHPDAPPVWQSRRADRYQAALDRLVGLGRAYPCACTRREIELAWAARGQPPERHGERVYPGTCRHGLQGRRGRAWRFHTGISDQNVPVVIVESEDFAIKIELSNVTCWTDRRLGEQAQDVEQAVGDFVLKRADGLWAYQLAVVVDDADQGVTHVVRGEDLADNTPRQIRLQQALGLPRPRYLHTPLVLGANGEKLSKQNGAAAVATASPGEALAALQAAASALGLPAHAGPAPDALAAWVRAWADLYNPAP